MGVPTFTEEAKAAIEGLHELREPVDYVVCAFKDGTTEMDVAETGRGGVANVSKLLGASFMDQICTGAFLVTGVDDRGSVVSYRRKFIHFIWIGPQAKLMQKAKVVSQSGAFKEAFGSMQLYLQIDDVASLSEAAIEKSLLSAGAAHKPKWYDFTNTAEEKGGAAEPPAAAKAEEEEAAEEEAAEEEAAEEEAAEEEAAEEEAAEE